uniref:Uncharacterized protein n=1 Tax=Ceratitis capitata TaxID=7213 RepID=W8BXS2_CERCA
MDFLFAPLPETNFQMNKTELRLWQRNAIFECECDNFINRRLEAAGEFFHMEEHYHQFFEATGIHAAIRRYGLRGPHLEENAQNNSTGSNSSSGSNNNNNKRNVDDEDGENSTDANANVSQPMPQRRRLMAAATERNGDNVSDRVLHEAVSTALRTRGLNVIQNP